MRLHRLLTTSLFIGASALALTGCELTDECDPDVEDCETTDAGTGTTDTGGGGTDTGGGGDDGYRYILIFDLSDPSSYSAVHPGSDIDAVEVVRNGQTIYAAGVADRLAHSDSPHRADDPSQILGPPGPGGGGGACDVDAEPEHWYSLGDGQILLDMGTTFQSGDEITIYECAGATSDSFTVLVGTEGRLEGTFVEVLAEGEGVVSITVP